MNPPLSRPSKLCIMKPPTKAPAIFSKIVTMVPPGSSPDPTSSLRPLLFVPAAMSYKLFSKKIDETHRIPESTYLALSALNTP